MSVVNDRSLLRVLPAAALTLISITALAQEGATPPPPGAQPQAIWHRASGGNHFAGPSDVVYLPQRPISDSHTKMYWGDWRDSEPDMMFGNLVVRGILTPGDNLSPPFPGAVLEHAKFLSLGELSPGNQTTNTTLKGVQLFFYVEQGSGELLSAGTTSPLHKGSAVLIPEGVDFSLRNTGTAKLNLYMIGDPTFPGFKPLSAVVVKDEAKMAEHGPATPSPFTSAGASGHWAHVTHGFFNSRNGLATIGGIITVEIQPMTLGEPHPHLPGKEEIWCEIEGQSLAYYGSQVLLQHPGQAYILRPDGLTTHSNIHYGQPGDANIKFLWFSTNTGISAAPH